MPSGTITVNAEATFQAAILMSAAQKNKFGTDEPDITVNGERKYSAEVAVTYRQEPGSPMKAVSEVLSVTVTGSDPSMGCPPGSAVMFENLRCGVSAPEKRDNGRISGGRLYWMASGVRAANGRPVAAAKSDG